MAGFSSVTGDEAIMFADNVSFNGTQRGGKVISNGQLLIGSTIAPHIRVSTLSSSDGSISITNGSGTIDLKTSASANFVITTPIVTGEIDFTSLGLTTIYTVPVGKKFIPYTTTVILDSVSGYSADGFFNLGFTAPNYDDFNNGQGFNVSSANTFEVYYNTSGTFNVVPSGSALILNVTTGITATTALGRVILTGSLF